ncbi:MAG: PRC-barrel domain-containing protein [Aristaeellaceae bacterium]
MRLGRVTGLPVICAGKVQGRVEQTVLCPDGRALRGVVVRRGFGGARWLGAEDILMLGEVSVIAGRQPGRMPRDAAFALGCVRDTAGLDLGRVTDVYLQPDTRRVIALEITLGPLEEIRAGRMLARDFTVHPAPGEPGQVLIPTGCALERLGERR